MKKSFVLIMIFGLLISGYASQLENKILESNLTVNSPEYIAYQNEKYLMVNDYESVLKYLDDDIKAEYHAELLKYLEMSIRYKYFEPVYDIFGENISFEQIQQVSMDNLLGSFLRLIVRRNFTFKKFELALESIEIKDTESDVKFTGRALVPYANEWIVFNSHYKLKKRSNIWVIIDDGQVTSDIIKKLKSIKNCQTKSFRIADYNKSIEILNTDVCTYRAQIKKGGSFENENPLQDFMSAGTFEENKRDDIFGNKYCMEFDNGNSNSLTTDIVSDETCEKLNITPATVTLPQKSKGPTSRAQGDFYFHGGELICRKEGSNEDTVVSKKTGWFDWMGNEIRHEDQPEMIKFYFTDCRDPE